MIDQWKFQQQKYVLIKNLSVFRKQEEMFVYEYKIELKQIVCSSCDIIKLLEYKLR